MQVGSGYVTREVCDGQSPASPSRWRVESRRYPGNPAWLSVAALYSLFSGRMAVTSVLRDPFAAAWRRLRERTCMRRELRLRTLMTVASLLSVVLARLGEAARTLHDDGAVPIEAGELRAVWEATPPRVSSSSSSSPWSSGGGRRG